MELIQNLRNKAFFSRPTNSEFKTKKLNQNLFGMRIRIYNLKVKLRRMNFDSHHIDIDMIEANYLIDLCKEKINELQKVKGDEFDLLKIDTEYYLFELSEKLKELEEILIYEKEYAVH